MACRSRPRSHSRRIRRLRRRVRRRRGGREVEEGLEMSITPEQVHCKYKLFELCEPPQREVKHSAKTAETRNPGNHHVHEDFTPDRRSSHSKRPLKEELRDPRGERRPSRGAVERRARQNDGSARDEP